MSTMNFGQALEALGKGAFISREGWNGKGMFLFQLAGDTIPKRVINDPMLRLVVNGLDPDSETFDALPSIRMKTADGKILTGWLASQADMFAEDWGLVAPKGVAVFKTIDGDYKSFLKSDIISIEPTLPDETTVGLHVKYVYGPGRIEKYLFAVECIGCFDVDEAD